MTMNMIVNVGLLCVLTAVFGDAAQLPEIILWPKGMPEPVVPASPPERIEKGPDQRPWVVSSMPSKVAAQRLTDTGRHLSLEKTR